MKGIVFNLLEQVVSDHYGADTWDSLVDAANVGGSYTSLGNYPDSEMEALVAAACSALSLDRATVLKWFGVNAMPLLAKAYPELFEGHPDARSFIDGVNDVIHSEVRKLYPDAVCPHFRMANADDGDLMMDYRSSRRMCALAEGFVAGAAAHFGDTVDFTHETCVDRGDRCCTFRLRWMPAGADAVAA